MTTIHNSTHQVTLTPKTPALTITGTIDAIGPAGIYAAYTLQSAVFATAPTDATIKNTGTILSTGTAGTDFGIVLGGAGSITNSGLIKAASGIFANGPATIKNTGTIKDLSNALIGTGIDMHAGGTLENTATGLIAAGTVGVFASTGQITNAGTIKAAYDAIDTTGGADIANAGLLEAEIGIAAASGAHITNTGKILVTTTGIFLDGSSVLNAGLISGGSAGILQFNGDAAITNAAAGTIIAKNQAVSLYAGTVHNAGLIRAAKGIVIDEAGAATNTGTISVTGYGIRVEIANDTVQNAGLITVAGTGGHGVVLDIGDTLANTGTISGQYHGIYITLYKSGAASAPGQITNAGLITAAQPASTDLSGTTLISAAILDRGASTITNLAHATISDTAGIGISVAGYKTFGAPAATYLPATIRNAGLIAGLYAIDLSGPGDIQNTGTITGTRYGIITNTFSDSLYNTGLITSPGSFFITGGTEHFAAAVVMNQTGTITNAATGTISGRYSGSVILKAGGAIYNHGSIHGAALDGRGYVLNTGIMTGATDIYISGGPGTVKNTGTLVSTNANGIDLAAGGMVTNTGLIEGWVNFGAAATIRNSGDITGAVYGFRDSAITIINAAHATIGAVKPSSGVEINNGYVYNAGLIAGDGAMIGGFQDPDTVTLVNKGTIWSNDISDDEYVGIYSRGAADIITNSGTIDGAGEGIEVQGRLNLTNTTSGTITGGDNAILAQYGGTIYNAGLIKNTDTAEPAIALDAGTNSTSLLIIAPTSTIIGAAAVSGELSLATGTGTISFAQFDVFETLALSTGATWQATGTIIGKSTIDNGGTLNAGSAGITLSRGGSVSNTGLIEGQAGLYIAASLYQLTNDLDNAGDITTGVKLGGASILINDAHGKISAANAISLTGNGTIDNQGLIYGAISGAATGINIDNRSGGRITAAGDAISLAGRAIVSVTNAGYIHGGKVGILLASTGHITDTGTVTGGDYAIKFTNGGSDYLALSPTAVTTGLVDIGGGQLTLMAGTQAGMLSTAQFQDITDLWVNAKADWTLTGDMNAPHIENNGTIFEASGQPLTIGTVGGVVYGVGTIEITSVVNLQNAVNGGQHLAFTGANQTLQLREPQDISQTEIEHFATGDTIDLEGISLTSITATHFIAGVLTLSGPTTTLQFTFSNPAAFTGETFALSAAPGATLITLAAAPDLIPTPPSLHVMPAHAGIHDLNQHA